MAVVQAVLDEASVPEGDDAVAPVGDGALMGDDEHGVVLLVAEFPEEPADVLGGGGVEVSGGFVGEEERAMLLGGEVGEEGSGDGGALLLAAGEGVGVVVSASGEAEAVKQRLQGGPDGVWGDG